MSRASTSFTSASRGRRHLAERTGGPVLRRSRRAGEGPLRPRLGHLHAPGGRVARGDAEAPRLDDEAAEPIRSRRFQIATMSRGAVITWVGSPRSERDPRNSVADVKSEAGAKIASLQWSADVPRRALNSTAG